MRSFIIATVASFALTAAACAIAAWAMWGRPLADHGSLHAFSPHHARSLPLWIAG